MRVADDRNLEDEQFLRDLIKNFVHRVLVFDNEIRISFYFGEEKTFPLVKREAVAIVRENLTMLHHIKPQAVEACGFLSLRSQNLFG